MPLCYWGCCVRVWYLGLKTPNPKPYYWAMQEELPSEASVGADASAHRILLETKDSGELTEAEHAALLLSSRDLATYQGQFRYYVPSKSEVAAPDITEVRVPTPKP